MDILDFPAEILTNIAGQGDVGTFLTLYNTCNLTRAVVENPTFSKEFWAEKRLKDAERKLRKYADTFFCTFEDFKNIEAPVLIDDMKRLGYHEYAYFILGCLMWHPSKLDAIRLQWMRSEVENVALEYL